MKAFISHSSIDKPFVERLATDLRTREGIDAWVDKWEILAGDSIQAKIEEGLTNAGVFLLVLSPESVNSNWVSREREIWLNRQIDEERRAKEEKRTPSLHLIPVLYKNCEKPAFISPLLHVSINDENYEEGYKELVRGIRRESGKPPLKRETTPASIKSETPPASVTSLPTVQSSENDLPEDPEELALNLLLCLRPSQLEKVIYFYKFDESELPGADAPQAKRSLEIIKLARQDGDSFSKLLKTIYKVAPHLKR
jgi:hypothetical protein